jgi:hypothetical protein
MRKGHESNRTNAASLKIQITCESVKWRQVVLRPPRSRVERTGHVFHQNGWESGERKTLFSCLSERERERERERENGPSAAKRPNLSRGKLLFSLFCTGSKNLRNLHTPLHTRVARWFVFKPKIPIWVNFAGRYIDWKNGYILWPFGIFYGHLVYFMTIWYILIWYIFACFGPRKSGNPAPHCVYWLRSSTNTKKLEPNRNTFCTCDQSNFSKKKTEKNIALIFLNKEFRSR